MIYNNLKIMGNVSYPKNLPYGWTILGYITSHGLLYVINKNPELLTGKELENKINIYNRKEKLNKINGR
jgi:hypothetical protein